MSAIVITETDGTVSYTVGSTPSVGAFVIPYVFFFIDELEVILKHGDDPDEVLAPSAYTVIGVPADDGYWSGSLTLHTAVTNTVVRINRALHTTKAHNFPETGAISIPAMNTLFSRLFSWIQDLQRDMAQVLEGADFSGPVSATGLTAAGVDPYFRFNKTDNASSLSRYEASLDNAGNLKFFPTSDDDTWTPAGTGNQMDHDGTFHATTPPVGAADSRVPTTEWVNNAIAGLSGTSATDDFVTTDGTSTPRRLRTRFNDYINAMDFNVKGDNFTNDTVALQAALDAAGAKGGPVYLPRHLQCITGSLNFPDNTGFVGDQQVPDMDFNNTSIHFERLGSALYTLPGAQFFLTGTSSIFKHIVCSPTAIKGAQQPNTAAFVDTLFQAASGPCGITIEGCAILGYAKLFDGFNVSRLNMRYNNIDCMEVIDQEGSYDSTRILHNHCWPFLTIIAHGGIHANDPVLFRGEYGFRFRNGAADTKVYGNLLLGFKIGMDMFHCDGLMSGGNWVDHPPFNSRAGSIGINWGEGCRTCVMESASVWGMETAVVYDMGPEGNVQTSQVSTELTDGPGIKHLSGHVWIGHHEARTTGAAAIELHTPSYNFNMESYTYQSIGSIPPIKVMVDGISSAIIRIGDGTWDGAPGQQLVGGPFELLPGTILNAATILLPTDGNFFALNTGATPITMLQGGHAEREVAFYIQGGPSTFVNSNVPPLLLLQGGINATFSEGSIITFHCLLGNSWAEKSRQPRDCTPVYANKDVSITGLWTFLEHPYFTHNVVTNEGFQGRVYLVSELPASVPANHGLKLTVGDALTLAYGSNVTGGGGNTVQVISNSAGWVMA